MARDCRTSWNPYRSEEIEKDQSLGVWSHEVIQPKSFWPIQILYTFFKKSFTIHIILYISLLSSVAQSCLTLCDPMDYSTQVSLSVTNSWSLLKLMSIESVVPSNHLILCRTLFLLPSIFPSIGVFSSESVLRMGWPKYWSFSFSVCPSNEYSRLISFRIDQFDLPAIEDTLQEYFSSTTV